MESERRADAERFEAEGPPIDWTTVRDQRDQLLAACDWTQLPDIADATRAAWAVHRQSLRDVTDTFRAEGPRAAIDWLATFADFRLQT